MARKATPRIPRDKTKPDNPRPKPAAPTTTARAERLGPVADLVYPGKAAEVESSDDPDYLHWLYQKKSSFVTDEEHILIAPLVVPVVARMQLVPTSAAVTVRFTLRCIAWLRRRHGHLDLPLLLTGHNITAWASQEMAASDKSRHTAILAVTRYRDNNKPKIKKFGRSPTAHPHTPTEMDTFTAAAQSLGDSDIGSWWRTYIDLTNSAGLRQDEAITATGQWIRIDGTGRNRRTTVTAVNRYGVIREIPVPGAAGQRLAAHAGNPELLLYPRLLKRRSDTVSALNRLARKHTTALTGYRGIRARHLWITRLLVTDMPFQLLAAVADLNRNTFVAEDLASYLTASDPQHNADAARGFVAHAAAARPDLRTFH